MYVAGLAATIDTALDVCGTADGNTRVLNQSTVGLVSSRITSGCTKDISVIVAVDADRTATDVNRCQATTGDSRNTFGRGDFTHRTHSTSAINIAHHTTASDIDRRIAIDNTGQRVVELTFTIMCF